MHNMDNFSKNGVVAQAYRKEPEYYDECAKTNAADLDQSSQLEERFYEMECALQSQHEIISQLEDKLEPVLQSDYPKDCGDECLGVGYDSPLIGTLKKYSDSIGERTSRLMDIIIRLPL